MTKHDFSIIGKKFGKLTVLSLHEKGKNSRWKCKCDCGNEIIVLRTSFKKQISCGCLPRIDCSDLVNKKFGKLEVIQVIKESPYPIYLCKCECGYEKIALRKYLLNGQTISCGCLKKNLPHLFKKTHGLIKTQAYHSWQGMKNRCLNKNDKYFLFYF